jgi:beta-fructofuranosidase
MNDPNGLMHWRGRYHLFYQHNPHGAFWGTMHWGHAVSDDLVHWEHLPIALTPDPDGPDADGCFSGCAVDHNGVPTLMYTGVRGNAQLPCLATSDDPDLITWHKHPANPLLPGPPPGDFLIFRDHSVWNEAGTWYHVIGAGIAGQGGTALLYRSEDLLNWEYLHPLVIGDKDAYEPFWTGLAWECPDFFALGDAYTLLVSVWDGRPHNVAWFTGEYQDRRLRITNQGLVDVGRSFYAPQKLIDSAGRRVLFGWLRERRSVEQQVAAGWSGVMSLPRILSLLPDGSLGMTPAPEVTRLRGRARQVAPRRIEPGTAVALDSVAGDCLEIDITLEAGDATGLGLNVRCSPGGEEQTTIRFEPEEDRLIVDSTRASLNPEAQGAVHAAALEPADEFLRLRIFLDRSVIEVFVNDRACITERIYPSRPDSLGIELFAEGGTARLRSLTAWEMGADA